jgi:hypothetical protein
MGQRANKGVRSLCLAVQDVAPEQNDGVLQTSEAVTGRERTKVYGANKGVRSLCLAVQDVAPEQNDGVLQTSEAVTGRIRVIVRAEL